MKISSHASFCRSELCKLPTREWGSCAARKFQCSGEIDAVVGVAPAIRKVRGIGRQLALKFGTLQINVLCSTLYSVYVLNSV